MRVLTAGLAALLALSGDLSTAAGSAAAGSEEQGNCVSWSQARSEGLIDKFQLRPAKDIKASVESRYGGKVVSFVICRSDGELTYRMAVFGDNGNVTFVTEPAQ